MARRATRGRGSPTRSAPPSPMAVYERVEIARVFSLRKEHLLRLIPEVFVPSKCTLPSGFAPVPLMTVHSVKCSGQPSPPRDP